MEAASVREVCRQSGESPREQAVQLDRALTITTPTSRLRDLERALVEAHGPRKHKRVTFYLPVELVEDLRNVVYWTRGVTLAGIVEEALNDTLRRRQEAQGGPFPRRQGPLKGGRPRRRH